MNKIPTTVEAQIRTRARNLPVFKCFVNKDWQQAQKAIVLIVRKHTNGNITLGNFFVDLKLRGVKDCQYMFNESPLRMEEIRKRYFEMDEECDYNLAHNIIHAGLEFAGDYGFEPHKNFKTAQYILDEDTDDIPLMEIPLGDNGLPVLEIPYGESCQNEIAILKKTAGNDFRMIHFDKNGKPQLVERTYSEALDEAMETGLDNYVKKYSGSKSFRENQVIIDLLFLTQVNTDEERKQIDDEYSSIVNDPRLSVMDDQPENDYEKELDLSIKYFEEGETDRAAVEFRKVIDRYPDDPLLWNIFLYNLSIDSDIVDKEAMEEAYSRFPDHPVIKAWYAEWLAQENRYGDIFALFNQISCLDALTTENIHMGYSVLPPFCFAYAMAWIDKKDILRAEPYYQMIVRMGLDYRLGNYIQEKMVDLKGKKISEMLQAGVFGSDETDNE